MSRSLALVLVALSLALGSGCRARVSSETSEPAATSEAGPASVDPTQILAERAAVREAVEIYVATTEARDPVGAAAIVTAETFEFYEDLRQLALAGSREQLEQRSLMVIMLVLGIRMQVPAAELERLDGRGLFEFAIADGQVGDLRGVDLSDVWIDSAAGRAQVRLHETPIVQLRREPQGWKIDLPAMIATLAPPLEQAATEQIRRDGKLMTAYALLSSVSPDYIEEAILDGPLE